MILIWLLLFTIIFLACSSCIHSVSFHLPITLQQKLSFHNSISTQNSTEWSSQSPSPSVRGETKVRGTAWGEASTGHPVINPKAKRIAGKERENGTQLLLKINYASLEVQWYFFFCLHKPKMFLFWIFTCKYIVFAERHWLWYVNTFFFLRPVLLS